MVVFTAALALALVAIVMVDLVRSERLKRQLVTGSVDTTGSFDRRAHTGTNLDICAAQATSIRNQSSFPM